MTSPAFRRRLDPRWRLAVGLFPVLLGVLVYRLAADAPAPPAGNPPPRAAGEATVSLTITRPGAPPQEDEVPWAQGQTVAAATRQAADTRWRGGGTMALLEELGGVPNQGPEGLNWQFEVNGRYATEGAGAVRLAPGDRVLWKLAPYE